MLRLWDGKLVCDSCYDYERDFASDPAWHELDKFDPFEGLEKR